MQKFAVHSYGIVRVKVSDIEAEDHRGAIAAFEADNDLQHEIARRIQYHRPGERIESFEADEGALPVGYLVDVLGDEDFSDSRSYDVDQMTGDVIEHGQEPGKNQFPNRFVAAVISGYRDGELNEDLAKSRDVFSLNRNLRLKGDLIPLLLTEVLRDLTPSDRLEAMARIDSQIADLHKAREALVDLPSLAVRHLDYAETEIPLILNGDDKRIGTIVREEGDLWRNASLAMNSQRIYGLGNILHYLGTFYALDVVITTHPDYHAVYRGSSDWPYARVLKHRDGLYRLRVFNPHQSATFGSLEAALAAIGK